MSCRASPPDCTRRQNFAGGRATAVTVADGLLRARSESDDDIKNYAENAMNELLGWYGYDKVSTIEARKLSLTGCSSSCSSSPQRTDVGSPKSRTDDVNDDASERDGTGGSGTPALDVESVTPNSTNGTITCAWCLKNGLKLFTLKTAAGETKAFCSELCFDQCRRAAFKKNRVCDWCKHVRHTVSYVDFQDKDHQLQFCSDKCLNQYKMHIFCKETQAYLQMHPHLQETVDTSSAGGRGPGSNLITPDLWLKDCKESANGGHLSSEEENGQVSSQASSVYRSDSNDVSEFCPSSTSSFNSKNNFKETFKPEIAAGLFSDRGNNNNQIGNSPPKQMEKVSTERTSSSRKPEMVRHVEDYRRRNSFLDSVLRQERGSSRLKTSISEASGRTAKSTVGRPSSRHSYTEQRTFNQLSPPPPSYPPPLINGSLSTKSTRSRSSSPLPSSTATSGLPPPPPLLSSEMLHSPMIHPQLYQQHQQHLGLLAHQQQQLEALLSAQARFGAPGCRPLYADAPSHASPLNLSASSSLASPFLPSATVVLPYPLVVPLPLPIPIPIPIPLPEYLKAKAATQKSKSSPSSASKSFGSSLTTEEQAKRVDSIVSKLMTRQQAERRSPGQDKADSACPGTDLTRAARDTDIGREDSVVEADQVQADCSVRSRSKRASAVLRERTKRSRNS